jgi:simple sugar transport system permease protein
MDRIYDKFYLAAVVFISLLISFSVAGIFILIAGANPLAVYHLLFTESLGTSYGLGQVFFKATTLIFTSLAVAFAFRGGLFNIGAEGQMNAGAFITAWVGFTFTAMPGYLLIPLSITAGFTGGALWGLIAGYLKARFGSHEVINTIMLNFIALAVISYLVNNVYNVPATIHTPEIAPSANIPRISSVLDTFYGSPFNFTFLISLACVSLVYFILWYTPLGYEIRTVGSNITAAGYSGMNTGLLTVITMSVAGGLAGLAGLNFVNGYKHYFELGFAENAGYMGIAVALIARSNPWIIIPVSLFFGILDYGGLVINPIVPKDIIIVIQAAIILFFISISAFVESRYNVR